VEHGAVFPGWCSWCH